MKLLNRNTITGLFAGIIIGAGLVSIGPAQDDGKISFTQEDLSAGGAPQDVTGEQIPDVVKNVASSKLGAVPQAARTTTMNGRTVYQLGVREGDTLKSVSILETGELFEERISLTPQQTPEAVRNTLIANAANEQINGLDFVTSYYCEATLGEGRKMRINIFGEVLP